MSGREADGEGDGKEDGAARGKASEGKKWEASKQAERWPRGRERASISGG